MHKRLYRIWVGNSVLAVMVGSAGQLVRAVAEMVVFMVMGGLVGRIVVTVVKGNVPLVMVIVVIRS